MRVDKLASIEEKSSENYCYYDDVGYVGKVFSGAMIHKIVPQSRPIPKAA